MTTAPDTEPCFTVVVPTFDRPELLREAILSVLDQSFADFECLVIDDGGTTGLDLPIDTRVRVIRRAASGGPAAARNTGLEHARGRYLTFLDDDDQYTVDRLESVVDALTSNPVVVCWRNGGRRVLDGDVSEVILDDLVPHLGQVSLWRESAPRFSEQYRASEDVAWWFDLVQACVVATVPHIGYIYRRHDGARHEIGPSARADGLRRLLSLQASYFDTHHRAAAFQWKQVGLAELTAGNTYEARRAFLQSLRLRPSLRTLRQVLRTIWRRFTARPPSPAPPS